MIYVRNIDWQLCHISIQSIIREYEYTVEARQKRQASTYSTVETGDRDCPRSIYI